MAITLVKAANGEIVSGNTLTVSLANVAKDNYVVCALVTRGTYTLNSGWKHLGSGVPVHMTGIVQTLHFYSQCATAAGTVSLTVNNPQGGRVYAIIAEFSGVKSIRYASELCATNDATFSLTPPNKREGQTVFWGIQTAALRDNDKWKTVPADLYAMPTSFGGSSGRGDRLAGFFDDGSKSVSRLFSIVSGGDSTYQVGICAVILDDVPEPSRFLISDGEQYYTIFDGALHPISITAPLTALKFKQYGTTTLPTGAMLMALNKPCVYMWSAEVLEQRMRLTVTAGKPAKAEVLREGVHNGKSTAFSAGKKLWILTGREYLAYDGKTIEPVRDFAYIPTTVIARAPTGGGEPYEGVNLLQPKRKNAFLADGTSTTYQLDTEGLDTTAVKATVNDTAMTEGAHFTVNRSTGKITFTSAPAKPTIAGQDNIVIEFSKTVSGYLDRVERCSVATMYGVGTNDRVFMSGNSEHRSTDWHSGLNDPSYFPDINYSLVGNENTAIMGYSRIGEYLLVIKEDNSQDSTIFLRSASVESAASSTETTAVFPLKQGVTGVGAVAKHSLATLLDEPLFLSRGGIYAITSNTITAERTVQNRSYFVDPKLTKEPNLQDAICVEWNGWLICCVNSHCYILDGKQDKTYKSQSTGAYVYECYYWDNVPAVCFMEYQGALYFGTADGRICRFNTDLGAGERYNDDGAAIACCWSTKADDDGDFMRTKSIPKKGCGLMIKPYTRSSCRVLIRTNRDYGVEVLQTPSTKLFDFSDVDFEDFLFYTNDGPQFIPLKTKVKKYITAQIIVENNVVNEGFGIFGIIKRFTVGNYVK